jgi:hypothetical protein
MPNFKHVILGHHTAGDIWTTGIHTNYSEDVDATHALFVGPFLDALFDATSGVQTHWSTDVHVDEVITYELADLTGRAIAAARSQEVQVGAATGDSPPPRDCVVIGLRTQRPGRAGRGRMYLPCAAVNYLTDGLLQPGPVAFFANAVGAAITALGAAGPLPVVWRPGIAPALGDPINSVTVSRVPGSQRRRSNKIAPAYATEPVVLAAAGQSQQAQRRQELRQAPSAAELQMQA